MSVFNLICSAAVKSIRKRPAQILCAQVWLPHESALSWATDRLPRPHSDLLDIGHRVPLNKIDVNLYNPSRVLISPQIYVRTTKRLLRILYGWKVYIAPGRERPDWVIPVITPGEEPIESGTEGNDTSSPIL